MSAESIPEFVNSMTFKKGRGQFSINKSKLTKIVGETHGNKINDKISIKLKNKAG